MFLSIILIRIILFKIKGADKFFMFDEGLISKYSAGRRRHLCLWWEMGASDLEELPAPKIIDFSGFIHHEKNKRCFLELSLSEIWCFGSLALSLPSTTHNVWYECWIAIPFTHLFGVWAFSSCSWPLNTANHSTQQGQAFKGSRFGRGLFVLVVEKVTWR